MVLLQAPIGPELILISLVVNLIITAGITYWVYRDASKRGSDSVGLWTAGVALSCFLALIPLGVIVVVAYFLVGRPDDTSTEYGDVDEEWS